MTIRGHLAQHWRPDDLPQLQQHVNAALQAALPAWLTDCAHEVAIDLHDMPFYGSTDDPAVAAWVCRGQAKGGTTYHYRCATIALLTRKARLTLAVVFVQPGMTMGALLDALLTAIAPLGITISCLSADTGFCSVAVLRRLEQAQIPAIVARPARGRELKALRTGPESRRAQDTLHSAEDGAMTVKVAVVKTYQRTRATQRRAVWCLFVYVGVVDSLGVPSGTLRQRYRRRFGIETSYRQLEQLRRPEGTRDDVAQSSAAVGAGGHRAGAGERLGVDAVALSASARGRTAPRGCGRAAAPAVPHDAARRGHDRLRARDRRAARRLPAGLTGPGQLVTY